VTTMVGVLILPASISANPPARPSPLTPEQFNHILKLEAQPEHAAVLDVHATFKSDREKEMEFTRASDDFWTLVYQGGFPTVILIMLIVAAPL